MAWSVILFDILFLFLSLSLLQCYLSFFLSFFYLSLFFLSFFYVFLSFFFISIFFFPSKLPREVLNSISMLQVFYGNINDPFYVSTKINSSQQRGQSPFPLPYSIMIPLLFIPNVEVRKPRFNTITHCFPTLLSSGDHLLMSLLCHFHSIHLSQNSVIN